MSLLTTPAVLLRAYDYSESSRILRFYTRDAGVLGVLARGVRRSVGRGGSALESFAGGVLTAHVRPTRELQGFADFVAERPRRGIGGSALRLGAAAVVAELILRHAGEEANPELFDALGHALDRIEAAPEAHVVATLLSAGWGLVGVLGYQPQWEVCVSCARPFAEEEMGRFDFAAGGVRCARCGGSGPRVGPGARAQLRGFLGGVPAGPLRHARAHLQLLSDFITYHVSSGRPLGSFAFLAGLIPDDDA